MNNRNLFLRLLALTMAASLTTMATAAPLRLVALGDMPYGDPAKVYPPYEALIDRINTAPPALVIHVGDTKSGSSLCSDKMLADQLTFLNRFKAPVLYTPGDNEWTDCHRKKAGQFNPFERLALIRDTYFATDTTLGKPLPLRRDQRVEQARLMIGNVMITTLHVTGSENGRHLTRAPRRDTFEARTRDAISWLHASFSAAKDADAVVIALHADMFRKNDFKPKKRRWRKSSAFRDIGEALISAAAAFEKPVLLIFGDSHVHRVFRPSKKDAPNLLAMEVYGAPDIDAVEVLIDTDASEPFVFSKIANPAAQ